MPASATYEPIATASVSGTSSAINFNSISGSYTDLRLVFVVKSNANINVYVNYNSNTASNHSWTYLTGDGTAASSARLGVANDKIQLTTAASANNGQMNLFVLDIFSYAGSTNKTSLLTSSQDFNGSGSVTRQVNLWASTAAITSINITSGGSMVDGTTATLYGIKAA